MRCLDDAALLSCGRPVRSAPHHARLRDASDWQRIPERLSGRDAQGCDNSATVRAAELKAPFLLC